MLIAILCGLGMASTPAWAAEGEGHHHLTATPGSSPAQTASPAMTEAMMADHPLVRGTLSDGQATERMAAFVAAYQEAKKKRTSTQAVFDAYIDALGVRRLVAHFEGMNASCHGALHNLGKIIAERTDDVVTAMAVCSDACTYACIHGAVKEAFGSRAQALGEEEGVRTVQQELQEMCSGPPLVADFFPGNCAHAAGHAYGIATGEWLRAATDLCDGFHNPEMRFYCETGIFMQLGPKLRRDMKGSHHVSKSARLRSNTRFCLHASRSISPCIRFLLGEFRNTESLAQLAKECSRVTGRVRKGCFNGYGYLSRGKVISRPERLGELCGQVNRKDREQCISGVVFAKKNHANKERIDLACTLLSDVADRTLCQQQRERHYYQLGNRFVAALP